MCPKNLTPGSGLLCGTSHEVDAHQGEGRGAQGPSEYSHSVPREILWEWRRKAELQQAEGVQEGRKTDETTGN